MVSIRRCARSSLRGYSTDVTLLLRVGPADDQPGAVDGYATYFTLICR